MVLCLNQQYNKDCGQKHESNKFVFSYKQSQKLIKKDFKKFLRARIFFDLENYFIQDQWIVNSGQISVLLKYFYLIEVFLFN